VEYFPKPFLFLSPPAVFSGSFVTFRVSISPQKLVDHPPDWPALFSGGGGGVGLLFAPPPIVPHLNRRAQTMPQIRKFPDSRSQPTR